MIVFRNKGLINTTAMTVSGVSAKETDNPIGVFGTGLKYAIAIILRNGGRVVIFAGKRKYVFGRKKKTVRGSEFQVITMNGKELGYTDRLGLNWEMWKAYRELWSNNKDEPESEVFVGTRGFDDPHWQKLAAGHTVICVEDSAFDRCHQDRDKIILPTGAIESLPGVEVHFGQNDHVFYKGIRVVKLGKPSLYTYNLTGHHHLTEDRTLLYPSLLSNTIARAIVQSTWGPFLTDVLHANTAANTYEGELSFNSAREVKPSPQFMSIAEDLYAKKKLSSAAGQLFRHFQDVLPGHKSPFIVDLTEVERDVHNRALALVKAALDKYSIEMGPVNVQYKSAMSGYAVTAGSEHITIDHKRLMMGEKELALRILEGIAVQRRGRATDQLLNVILFGGFIPEELVTSGGSSGQTDDIPF